MDKKAIIAIILVVALVAVGTTMVLEMNPSGGEDEGPVTVIDAEGRTVTTEEAPTRLVSCSPSLTEMAYAMGIGERLVAVTDYCDWPADVNARKTAGTLATVGGYFTPSVEAVIAAEGDLVLLDRGVQAQMDMLTQLENAGLNVIVLDKGTTFDEVYDAILMIGEICWVEDEAEDLIDSMNARLASIEEDIGDIESIPTMAFAVWLDPIYLSGNGTFAADVMSHAKGENVYSNLTGWPDVSVESMLETDPEYLVVSMMYLPSPGAEIISGLENDTVWSELSAVQNKRVYILTGQCDNVFSRPGPRMVDAVELLAQILHPDVFNVSLPHVISDDYVDWVSSGETAEAEAAPAAAAPMMAMAQARIE
ncbi:MAG: ABC transporter substrate-binding protein [Methanomassiliicoccales archaeon]|nr:ABC transporter substrate-binding protein [Methanomassiliicoccales archaeon]